MISSSKENYYDHCLTGSYEVKGEATRITTKLYNTQSGQLEHTHTFIGRDFFSLLDSISMMVKKDLDFTQKQIHQFVDLPFEEAFTSNLEAYKNYALFSWTGQIKYLEQAVTIDSTFALAHYVLARHLFSWSFSTLGAKEAIEKSMRFRKRLPENWKANVKRLYFQINDQPEKAIALLKMQLEMNPGNQNHMHSLTNYYYLTSNYGALLKWRKKLATLDPNPKNKIDIAEALLLNGRFDDARQEILEILDRYPNYPDALGALTIYYVLSRQYDKADSLMQKLLLQDPEFDVLAQYYLPAFQYARDHPPISESLKKYIGRYRLQIRAADYDIGIIQNHLFGKGRAHMKGFFFIPSGTNQFMMGDENIMEEWTFVSDSSGRFYRIDAHRVERNESIFDNVLWRQDSLIERAMGLFSFDKKEEALEAFRIAYDRNPQHFYLNQIYPTP